MKLILSLLFVALWAMFVSAHMVKTPVNNGISRLLNTRDDLQKEIEERTSNILGQLDDEGLKKVIKYIKKLFTKFENKKISEEEFEEDLMDFFADDGLEETKATKEFVKQVVDHFLGNDGPDGDDHNRRLKICWACPFCAIFAAPLSLTFPALNAAMQGRCQSSTPLSGLLRSKVSCNFPASLDLNQVKIYWGCQFLNEKLIFGKSIGLVPDGQTFGYNIFLDEYPPSTSDSTAGIVTHELKHVEQYKKYGGLIKFGFNYLYHFCLRGFKYEKIDEEVEAYNFGDKALICPPTKAPTRKPTKAPVPTQAPTKIKNGAPCSSPSQCASGNCESLRRVLLPPTEGSGGGGPKRCAPLG